MGDYMWNRKEDSVFMNGEINGSYESWYTNRVAPLWYTAGKANVDVHCYWIAECHVCWDIFHQKKKSIIVHFQTKKFSLRKQMINIYLQKPYRDMIVQVPEDRRYNASEPEQSEALPAYFSGMIERILKYQSYKQQVSFII